MLVDRCSELELLGQRCSTKDKRCIEIHLLAKGKAAVAVTAEHISLS